MKTKFTLNPNGSVTIAYDDMGESIVRDFYTGKSDGLSYVYDGHGKQICDRMRESGSTLMSSRDALISTLRTEFRKMRADEKKYAA